MNVQWKPVVWISLVAVLIWATIIYLQGCAHKPKFMNGDETVMGPKSYGEVVEDDMPRGER